MCRIAGEHSHDLPWRQVRPGGQRATRLVTIIPDTGLREGPNLHRMEADTIMTTVVTE